MRRTILILTLLVLCGCSSKIDGEYHEVIVAGHAGSGFNYLFDPFNPLPANSWASILKAISEGAEGIEIDVQLSVDKELILYHDVELDSQTDFEGCIGEKKASDIIGLEYKVGFPFDMFHKEKVIGLDQLSLLLKSQDLNPFLYFDLKPEIHCGETDHTRYNEMAGALNLWLDESNYDRSKIYMISGSIDLLNTCRDSIRDVQLVYTGYGDIRTRVQTALAQKYHAIIFSVDHLEGDDIAKVKQSGLEVMLFGGKSTKTIKKMLQSGADVIQVNHVAKAVRFKESLLYR